MRIRNKIYVGYHFSTLLAPVVPRHLRSLFRDLHLWVWAKHQTWGSLVTKLAQPWSHHGTAAEKTAIHFKDTPNVASKKFVFFLELVFSTLLDKSRSPCCKSKLVLKKTHIRVEVLPGTGVFRVRGKRETERTGASTGLVGEKESRMEGVKKNRWAIPSLKLTAKAPENGGFQ